MSACPTRTRPLNPASLLSQIRVVLVGTQHPGNIGAAARALKNMGIEDLALVAPLAFPHKEATAMAASATDLLDSAKVFDTLEDAVADCQRIAATSARPRALSQPVHTPREWTTGLAATPPAGRTALLFGRERTGLTNEELESAHELIVIPTSAAYSSLNLAAAVQILAYELSVAAEAPIPRAEPHLPVDQAELERFYDHLQRVLVRIRFLDPENPRFLLRRLRRLYGRAQPDANEMNILRGILTETEKTLDRDKHAP